MAQPQTSPVYIPPIILENSRIRLERFEFEKHGTAHLEAHLAHPSAFRFAPRGAFTTLTQVAEWANGVPVQSNAVYAVIVKCISPENTLQANQVEPEAEPEEKQAGMANFICSDGFANATSSLGVAIYPPFQRTFVTTNAVGLMLQYLLEAPPQGLALRRVEWTANPANAPSMRAAERLGFVLEGVSRWKKILPLGKEVGSNGIDVGGLEKRTGEVQGRGADSAVFAMYWDEWEEKRRRLKAMMER